MLNYRPLLKLGEDNIPGPHITKPWLELLHCSVEGFDKSWFEYNLRSANVS